MFVVVVATAADPIERIKCVNRLFPFILRCPQHFGSEWLSKIKTSVSSENWRLRVSNIKKVVEGMVDFYESVLQMSITGSNFKLPDAVLIGRDSDERELGRLLQLMLVAAVNCDRKETYIDNILTLGTETQMFVKNAIEELFVHFGPEGGRNRSSTMESISSINFLDANLLEGSDNTILLKNEIKRLRDELSQAIERNDKTEQQMFDLKRELSIIQEQKVQLSIENENLVTQIQKLENSASKTPPQSSDHSVREPVDLKDSHVSKLQAKIESLRESLFKTENSREEVRMKNELLEKELMELKFRNEDLQRKANEARSLKDELDILRQASEKAEKYEQMVEVYRKKLEEAAELKRKFRSIEEKGSSQSSLQLSLEEELRKNSHLKSQIESLKKQVQELHSASAALNHRSEQSEFELSMIKEKYDAILQEKDHLLKEVSEMRKQTKITSRRPNSDLLSEGVDALPAANLCYEISSEEKDYRINELEAENELLKKKIMKTSLEQEESNRSNNHSNPFNHNYASTGELEIQKLVDSLRGELYDYQQKVSQLEGVIVKKDEEIASMETRYRTAVSKAKQVAKVLEPISLSSSNSSMNSSIANVEQLALELQMKDKQIQNMESEAEKTKQFHEVEARLMSTAWHSHAARLHRRAVEERLMGGTAQPATAGSFLSRQRQSTGKRFNLPGLSHT